MLLEKFLFSLFPNTNIHNHYNINTKNELHRTIPKIKILLIYENGTSSFSQSLPLRNSSSQCLCPQEQPERCSSVTTKRYRVSPSAFSSKAIIHFQTGVMPPPRAWKDIAQLHYPKSTALSKVTLHTLNEQKIKWTNSPFSLFDLTFLIAFSQGSHWLEQCLQYHNIIVLLIKQLTRDMLKLVLYNTHSKRRRMDIC